MSAGFAHLFEGLDAEKLFAIEDRRGECDDASKYIESLLRVLAEWRRRLVWRPSERAEYERALNATREAWLQWSFRGTGNEWLPESFDLPRQGGAGQ